MLVDAEEVRAPELEEHPPKKDYVIGQGTLNTDENNFSGIVFDADPGDEEF